MKNEPNKLFLQIGANPDFDDFDELLKSQMSFSIDRSVYKNDIEFINKSKIEELVKKMEIAKKDYQDHSSGSSVFGIRASEVQIAINQLTELIK